jgi:hypothetical protein
MPFDIDGSVGFILSGNGSGTVTQMTAGELANLNDQTNSTVTLPSSGTYSWGLIFPELRDIKGIVHAITNGWSSQVQTSTDTTNGLDGTWTTQIASLPTPSPLDQVVIRTSVQSCNMLGVKSIRINSPTSGNRFAYWLHLYGSISDNTGLDKLRVWHPTLDEPLDDSTSADGAHLDWAEVTRGTTADKTLRIKNNSAILTANSVTLTTSVPTDASPTIGPQITYSDGGAFATTLNIGNLAPGAISSVITIRRTTSSTAALSLWTWRTICEAVSWT